MKRRCSGWLLVVGWVVLATACDCGTGRGSAVDAGASDTGTSHPDGSVETCAEGTLTCDDEGRVVRCVAGGREELVSECGEGMLCDAGECVDLCHEPDRLTDTLGCEHWAVPTLNSLLGSQQPNSFAPYTVGVEAFHFAIVVSNPNESPVDVRITGNGGSLSRRVPADASEIIELPWHPSISQVSAARLPVPEEAYAGSGWYRGTPSVLASDAAYHVTSTGPVVAVQFNPLEHIGPDGDAACDDTMSFGGYCYSHTNDASLLRPVHALGERYRIVSRRGRVFADTCDARVFDGPSGFVTIVGVGPEPTEVSVLARAPLRGGGPMSRVESGDTVTRTLEPGDVWQLVAAPPRTLDECDPIAASDCAQYCRGAADLTGTLVTASGPVAVFSGHDCANAPDEVSSCEHLEEQLRPLNALDREYVVSPLPRFFDTQGPTLLRVVAVEDGTTVRFEPATAHPPTTLDAGEHLEVELSELAILTADAPVAVYQFSTGQRFEPGAPNGADHLFAYPDHQDLVGSDPTLIGVAPLSSWALEYLVEIPSSFAERRVQVIASDRSEVFLDDVPLATDGGALGYAVGDAVVSPGTHALRATGAFLARVVGVGPYTAYGHEAGATVPRDDVE